MTPAQSAIIARLESATGPDRELDKDIAREIGWMQTIGTQLWYWPHDLVFTFLDDPPDFTGSLDAALTLVPDGMSYVVGYGVGGHLASVGHPSVSDAAIISAATAHLALCIAALKTRWSDERNAT